MGRGQRQQGTDHRQHDEQLDQGKSALPFHNKTILDGSMQVADVGGFAFAAWSAVSTQRQNFDTAVRAYENKLDYNFWLDQSFLPPVLAQLQDLLNGEY